ncbi:hypothetical protein QOT17_015398 [Balamuthia mandrillaris]
MFSNMFQRKAKESAGKATLEAQRQSCYVLPPTAPADLSFVIDSKAVLNFYKKKEVYLEQNGTLALVFSLKAKNLIGLPTLELLDLQNRQVMAAACNSGMVASSWTWTVLQAAQPIATITGTRVALGTCRWQVDFPQRSQPGKSIQQGEDEAAEFQQPPPTTTTTTTTTTTSLTVEGTSVLTICNSFMRGSQEVGKLKRLRLDNLGRTQFGLEVKAGENAWFMLLLSALIATMADTLRRELIKDS